LGTFILNTNISSVFEFFFQHRRILVLLLSSPLADFLRLCCHGITTMKKLERNGQSSSEGALFFRRTTALFGKLPFTEDCLFNRAVSLSAHDSVSDNGIGDFESAMSHTKAEETPKNQQNRSNQEHQINVPITRVVPQTHRCGHEP